MRHQEFDTDNQSQELLLKELVRDKSTQDSDQFFEYPEENSSIYGNEDHLLTQQLNDEYFNLQDEEYPALQAKYSNIESEVDESKSNRKRQQTKKRGNQTQEVTIEDEVTDSQVSKKKQTAKKSDNNTKVITDKDNGKIINQLPGNSSKNKKKASQTKEVTIEDEVTDSQVSKKKQTAKKSDNNTKVITDKDNGKIFNQLPGNSSKNKKKASQTKEVIIEDEVTDSQVSKKKQTAKKSETQSVIIEDEVTDSQVSKKKQTAKKSDNNTKVITDKDNGKIFNQLPGNSSKNKKKEESGSKIKKDTNTNVPLPSKQDKTTINSNTPSDDSLVPSSLSSDIVRLSVYGNQKCMINKKGALNCWWFKEESGWSVQIPQGFESNTKAVSVGNKITCATNNLGVTCWRVGQYVQKKGSPYTKVVNLDYQVNEQLKQAKSISCKDKYLCAYINQENKCQEQSENANLIKEQIILPEELKSAKDLEANHKLITGITKQGDLFTQLPLVNKSKNLGQVKKFASRHSGICAINSDNDIACYDPYFETKTIPTEFKFKAQQMSISDKAVCAVGNTNIKCWDFFQEVREFKNLHNSKEVKQIYNTENMVCSVNKQSQLLCEKSDLGHFKVAIPKGQENNVKKVVTGVSSTAVIDTTGDLKFWFNKPFYNSDDIKTFSGQSNGKMSMSKNYFCAINDAKKLECQRVLPITAKLVELNIPPFLREDCSDVSVGKDQICALSSKSAIVCWGQTSGSARFELKQVPDPLYKLGEAQKVVTSFNKHCGIDNKNKLYCWGMHQQFLQRGRDGRKYDEAFEGVVKDVSVGYEYMCQILSTGELKCQGMLDGVKNMGVPEGLEKGTKQVSVGREEVCAIDKLNKVKCWDYNSGVKKVPTKVFNSEISQVSAGQQHNCAVTKQSKLSCWLVDSQ